MPEEKNYIGQVVTEVVETRFAYSGKVANVYKKPGDRVKIGDFLASLDRKILQTMLDRELADYEKVRAEFEIFALQNPNPTDDKTKYLKTEAQATLDAAVKTVEIAKYNLDEADLKSPVNGVVLDNNGMRTGMYVTPGSYAYQLLDSDSTVIETEIKSEEREVWQNKDLKLTLKADGKETIAIVSAIVPDMKGKLLVKIKPEDTEGFVAGSNVSLTIVSPNPPS